MAAIITKQTGARVELVEGGRGEFTVWVGDEKVAEKTGGAFPSDEDAVAAAARALAT